MRFFLVGITNGSTKVYHRAYVNDNGEEQFVEMRRTKYAKKHSDFSVQNHDHVMHNCTFLSSLFLSSLFNSRA